MDIHSSLGLGPSVSVVGVGSWGKNILRNLANLGSLHSIVDVDDGRASHWAREFGVRARCLEDVLADQSVNAVAISTPSVYHYTQTRAALLAGKHVFVEKPLALSVGEATDVVSLAAQRDRRLMVGHLLRFHPAFQKALEIIRQGEIGPIRAISSSRLSAGPIRSGDDALWDLAPHDVSMICAIVGETPTSVEARGAIVASPNDIDIAHVWMNFPKGIEAQISVSRVHPFKEQRLVVIGETGMLVFEDSQPDPARKLTLYRHRMASSGPNFMVSATTPIPVLFDASEPLRAECTNFLDSIRNGGTPLTDGGEAVRVVKILAEAASCISKGGKKLDSSWAKTPATVLDFGAWRGSDKSALQA